MFRRFYRIGFGGCGCALEDHFIEHANVIFRDILLKDYKKLAKWENGLANEYRLMMKDKLKKLRELIFTQERETSYSLEQDVKYRKVDRYVDEWHESLEELTQENSDVMPYEREIVKEIDRVNRIMNDNVEAMTKPENVVLLEGLTVDSFSGTGSATGGTDKPRFLYNTMIKKTRPLIVNKYDKDILDSEGFDHHPELQMLPLSIKEVRYEVYEVISEAAGKGTEIGSRGNFFFVGLGGGTGTGVISPLAEQFGKGSRGYFTLGILGGKDDNEYLGSQQPWFRRCFNILLALNDLIATADLDGIILVDNEILMDRLKKREELEKNEAVLSDRGELKKFLIKEFGMDWVENTEISESVFESDENEIIRIYDAENFAELNIGKKRQRALLKISDGRIYDLKVEEENGKRKIHGKTHAEKIDEELTRIIYPAFGITACEEKGSDIDWTQLKHHMKLQSQEQRSPIFVPCYASGGANTNTKKLIEEALDTGMLSKCEYKIADKIIGYVRNIEDEVSIKKILSEKFETSTADVIIIKRDAERASVLGNLSAKIIVFESKKSKEEDIGENEVLLLLRNCNVKDTLYNRIKVAQSFVDLLDAFKDLIEERNGLSTERIASEIIDNERDKLIDFIEVCLFSWDNVPGDDTKRIRSFLKEGHHIDWAENAEVEKHDDGKTIRIFKDENSAEIIIDDKNEKATLKIKDVEKTHDLKVKKEDGKLNIYKEVIPTDGIEPAYLFSWDIINRKDNEGEINKLKSALKNVFYIDWAEDLKITPSDNKIICKPAGNMEGKTEITIEKVAKETATLKIGGDKTYNLIIIAENGEQKVYESENRASEKILQEAKSFLLPMDIGPQKRDEAYKEQIEIVANLKEVVNDAITNLDEGNMPIFTKSIFKIKSAAASDDEVILTLMLAMGKSTYFTYRDALGGDKVDQLFNNFQREVLEDRSYVENSGGADDYILTYRGENVLADALRKKLDDEVSKAIEKPSDLLKVIGTKKFLKFVKEAEKTTGGISFPKLLVLSCLYTKWESVFSWNINSGIDENELRKFLSKDIGINWVENKGKREKLDEKTLYIPKDENNSAERIEILIDENAEKAILKIRTDMHSFDFDTKAGKINLDIDDISQKLAVNIVDNGYKIPKDHSWNNEGDNEWTIRGKKDNEENHYIKRDDGGNLKIYPDIIHELKVKEAEEGKLKIYKRRGEQFY